MVSGVGVVDILRGGMMWRAEVDLTSGVDLTTDTIAATILRTVVTTMIAKVVLVAEVDSITTEAALKIETGLKTMIIIMIIVVVSVAEVDLVTRMDSIEMVCKRMMIILEFSQWK